MNINNNAYQGYENLTHKLKMTSKMMLNIGAICLVLQLMVAYAASQIFMSAMLRDAAFKYPLAKFLTLSFMGNTPLDLAGDRVTAATLSHLSLFEIYGKPSAILTLIISFAAWFAYPSLLAIFKNTASDMKSDEHVRGAQLVSETELQKELNANYNGSKPGLLKIGSVTIPDVLETRHAFIFGLTGAGKSVLLFQYLAAIQEAIRRCVCNDFKGELTAVFFRPGTDKLLNPLDKRGLGWTIFNEIKIKADFSAIAGSLIPPSSGDDRFWSMAAQDVFRGIMAALWQQGKRTNADLWAALTSPVADIAELLKTTPMGAAGLSYIQDASSKQAASVIAVLMSYVSWLEYAIDGDFSTRAWVESGSGTIFITGRTEIENTVKPFTSMFIDLLGKRILSAPDTTDESQTIHLLLDEFSNMQKLPTIKRLTTAGRSKRSIITLAAQEIAAIEHINGREDTRTLLNNTALKLVLQLNDPDAMDYFSKLAGREEYWQSSTTYSMSVDESKGGENHGRQLQTRDVIMSSEIRQLRVGEGYLIAPACNPAKVKINMTDVNKRKHQQPDFVLRDGMQMEDLESIQYKSESITERAAEIMKSEPPEELKKLVEQNHSASQQQQEQNGVYDLDI